MLPARLPLQAMPQPPHRYCAQWRFQGSSVHLAHQVPHGRLHSLWCALSLLSLGPVHLACLLHYACASSCVSPFQMLQPRMLQHRVRSAMRHPAAGRWYRVGGQGCAWWMSADLARLCGASSRQARAERQLQLIRLVTSAPRRPRVQAVNLACRSGVARPRNSWRCLRTCTRHDATCLSLQ